MRDIANESCPICKNVVYADEGYYSITMAHYDCAFPGGYREPLDEFAEAAKKADAAFDALGLKRKRVQAPIGTGGPTKKLIQLIEVSAREHFETDDVTDVRIYLPPPVWRQFRFDVMRVEGSFMLCGIRHSLGSWASVTDLIKYRRVKFVYDHPQYEILPIPETRRGRKAA